MKPLVSVRMSTQLLQDAEKAASDGGFSSTQEFVRHAIREEVLRKRRREAVIQLKQLYGSGKKNFVPVSKEEMRALIQEEF